MKRMSSDWQVGMVEQCGESFGKDQAWLWYQQTSRGTPKGDETRKGEKGEREWATENKNKQACRSGRSFIEEEEERLRCGPALELQLNYYNDLVDVCSTRWM